MESQFACGCHSIHNTVSAFGILISRLPCRAHRTQPLCTSWLHSDVDTCRSPLTPKQVTGTAYIHIDRGRGASADLSLMELRAAVLASDALAPAAAARSASSSSKDKDAGSASAAPAAGPTVEAAPFQKVGKACCLVCL